jgi:hypothetical protein
VQSVHAVQRLRVVALTIVNVDFVVLRAGSVRKN